MYSLVPNHILERHDVFLEHSLHIQTFNTPFYTVFVVELIVSILLLDKFRSLSDICLLRVRLSTTTTHYGKDV